MDQPQILIWGSTPFAAWLVAALAGVYPITWRTDDTTLLVPTDRVKIIAAYESRPDFVIFAMPNWAVTPALQEMRMAIPWDEPAPPILMLQNGVGSIQRIDHTFGEGCAIAAAVTCEFPDPKTGGFALQADHPSTELALNLLRVTGLPVKLGSAASIGWSSVFWGIQANALSTIFRVDPAEIYRNPRWFGYEAQQLTEALFVIEKLGVPLISLPGVNVPHLAWAVRRLPRPLLAAYLLRQPRPPALRPDLEQKTGRSDAAYFNGAVAVHAHDLRYRTPMNHVLALAVTDIAEGRQSWEAFGENPELLEAMVRLAQ